MMKASLYIHIPFCKSKCRYCDFESYANRDGLMHDYISNVIEEARLCRKEYGAFGVPSVYIGGGTPSYLPKEETARLMEAMSDIFAFDRDAEITTEANPGTVDEKKLHLYKKAGINRISFGVQAAQAHILKSLGRIHTWSDAKDAVKMSRDAGIDNINMDLMYALPSQTTEDFVKSVQKAVNEGVTHISMYSLILEGGTPLYESALKGEVDIPGDDESVAMQDAALEFLKDTPFERYEISNYSLKGCECRHNIVYWTRGNYLGLGCSAHSLMNEKRFSNPSFDHYMRGERKGDVQEISLSERMEESVMLETRMTRGLDLEGFSKAYGEEMKQRIERAAFALSAQNLARVENGSVFFTKEGLNLQNALVVRMLEALDKK